MEDKKQNTSKAVDKWDVVVVSFYPEDNEKTKQRPALVVSPAAFNKDKEVIIVFITSNLEGKELFGDYKIKDWKEAGLLKPGKVQMNFCSVKSERLKKIGKLSKKDSEKVESQFSKFFKI